MPKPVKPLTEKQKGVLNYISSFLQKYGYSPSLKEIGKFIGTQNLSTAQYYVEELERKGYLKKSSHKTRGITPTSTSQTVPLLGIIAAGEPIEPIENPEDIEIPRNIKIESKYPHYALKVEGDSMKDMGIFDRDVVLIRHQLTAQNGDVIVGITEKGATLKIYQKKNSKIYLEPRNDDYPVIKPKKLEVRGKFVGLIRDNLNTK